MMLTRSPTSTAAGANGARPTARSGRRPPGRWTSRRRPRCGSAPRQELALVGFSVRAPGRELVVKHRGRVGGRRGVGQHVVVRDHDAVGDQEPGAGAAVGQPDLRDRPRSLQPDLEVADRDERALDADDLLELRGALGAAPVRRLRAGDKWRRGRLPGPMEHLLVRIVDERHGDDGDDLPRDGMPPRGSRTSC